MAKITDKADESRSRTLVDQPEQVNRILAKTYPGAKAELDFKNPFELLVATILSAQSTDRRVNTVTPKLFAEFPDAKTLSAAPLTAVEEIIYPTGFFRNKAANLVSMASILCREYHGEVPNTLTELVKLPGVGRKTANVVLGNAFGIPGITPDTHFIRVSNRLGWVSSKNPDIVEREVGKLFPPKEWVQLCHHIIWHGRRRCHALKPACGACPIAELCPAFGIGPVDFEMAKKLIKEPRR